MAIQDHCPSTTQEAISAQEVISTQKAIGTQEVISAQEVISTVDQLLGSSYRVLQNGCCKHHSTRDSIQLQTQFGGL